MSPIQELPILHDGMDPYAQYAEMMGLRGIKVEEPDDVGAAWDQLLAADRPAVLEVVTDPGVPPIPPTVTYEQAKNYASAVLKGDPEALNMIKESIQEVWASMFPDRD